MLLQPAPAKTLRSGEIGVCNLELGQPILLSSDHGRFTLLDDEGGETLGVGLLHVALRRAQSLRFHLALSLGASLARALVRAGAIIRYLSTTGAVALK